MKKLLLIFVFAAAAVPAAGQWSDNPEQNNQMIFERMYDWDSRILSDGSSVIYYNCPSRTLVNQDTVFSIKHVLIRYNADGTPAWSEPLVVANTPNRTFVMVNDHLFISNNDDIYLGISDCRYDTFGEWAGMNLSVYKINKDGEQLWGDNGVSIDKQPHGFIAQSNAIALEDASVIIAREQEDNNIPARTKIARISSQGEVLWDKDLSPAGKTARIVNGGNHEFIVVYTSGTSIHAQKLDFDGELIWGPIVIYDKGGMPSAPMHANLKVLPVERGAFVSWYADPDANRAEDAYCSYIDLDGNLVFASGTSGVKLGYSNLRQFSPIGVYDPDNKCVYYMWSEMNGDQTWSGMKGQKIFLTGELGWESNAVWVAPYLQRRSAYPAVDIDNEGNPCFFYIEQTKSMSDYTGYAQKRTPAGDSLWDITFTKIVDDDDHIYNKTSLVVLPFVQNQWIALWKDNRPLATSLSNQDYIWGQNILSDGRLGNGIAAVETKVLRSDASFSAILNPASGNTSFVVKNMQGEKVEIFVSNAMGQKVTTLFNGVIGSNEQQITWNIPAQISKGVYFATLRSRQRSETIKVIKN
jgi:hypothetical protein